MTGGEGPSAAEVAASLPARLLGAIEELQKFSEYSEAKEEEGEEKIEISLKRKDIFSMITRSGFYRPISA